MKMLVASGYPVPGKTHKPVDPLTTTQAETFNEASLIDKITAKIRELFNPKNTMKKQFQLVNTALKVEKLESTDEGVFVNEIQLEAIETELARIPAAETARTNAETERDNANAARTTAENAFNAIDPTVAAATTPELKVAAVKALLAAKPGTQPAGRQTTEDPNNISADGVDWETLNKLPHMNIEV
jgi:hypothetical protein